MSDLIPYKPFKTMLKEVGEEGVMENVLTEVSEGRTPNQIAKDLKIPFYEFMKWLHEDNKRINAYYRAQELWAEKLHSEVIEIADNATEEDVQVAKLRIRTRQEVASNYNRKRFGKVELPESQKFSGGITINITGVDKPQFVEVVQDNVTNHQQMLKSDDILEHPKNGNDQPQIENKCTVIENTPDLITEATLVKEAL